jgi:hypothetical protein
MNWVSSVTLVAYPIFILTTIYTASKIDGYLSGAYSLSALGCKSVSPGHKFFRWVTFIYGVLLCVFAITSRNSGQIPLILTLSQFVVGFATAFAVLVPTEVNRFWHNIIGGSMFPAAVIMSIYSLQLWTSMAILIAALLMGLDAIHFVLHKYRKHLNWYVEWVFVFLMGTHFTVLALGI